jgi:hypothetical protein
MDNSKVKEVIDMIPSLDKLVKWIEKNKLREQLDDIHPLAYPLIRFFFFFFL